MAPKMKGNARSFDPSHRGSLAAYQMGLSYCPLMSSALRLGKENLKESTKEGEGSGEGWGVGIGLYTVET